jgi:hypothetical protein
MARQASIRTPTRGPAHENTIVCRISVSLRIYPSTALLSRQSASRFPVHDRDTGWTVQRPRIGEGREKLIATPALHSVKPFTTYLAAGCNEDKASRS